tara:strand:- start:94 stop:336 length:243 start_codon:yes stop_codon:yes gene_type:complete
MGLPKIILVKNSLNKKITRKQKIETKSDNGINNLKNTSCKFLSTATETIKGIATPNIKIFWKNADIKFVWFNIPYDSLEK